jgi:hypothetical protein
MGQALNSTDCLRQAHEFLTLAQSTGDVDLRNRYLKLAAELTELAGKLDASGSPDSDGLDFSVSGGIAPAPDARSEHKRR